jgi:hypothetical protein
MEAARWARDHTGKEDVFAIIDAGIFGYFSQRPVVNLDGKANSYEFLRYVQSGTVDAYLKSANVRYVADIRMQYRNGQARLFIPRVNERRVPLVMDEAWEVYRGPAIPSALPRVGRPPMTHFVIWKLPGTTGS